MRIIYLIIWACLISTLALSKDLVHSYHPKDGFIPSEKTAVAIAEAVLVPIYGQNEINSQKPFKVMLKDNVWIVKGSFSSAPGAIVVGGSFTIHMSKATGEILRVTHDK